MNSTQTHWSRQRDALSRRVLAMSALLYTFLGLTVGTLYCSVRPSISPCTCMLSHGRTITIACEQMSSFAQVKESLDKGNFSHRNELRSGEMPRFTLRISHSKMEDLDERSFQELGFGMEKIRLKNNNLTSINKHVFANMSETKFLSLPDNLIVDVPGEALSQMPSLETLDIGWCRLTKIMQTDFKALPRLQFLLLAGNNISMIEHASFPLGLIHLHLGHNKIQNLNGSISGLTNLKWLFLNGNNISSLESQMPNEALNLQLIHIADNQLIKLPTELNSYPNLASLFLQNNQLKALSGAIKSLKKLERLHITNNKIDTILQDDFLDLETLQDLQAGFNQITALNGSLLPLRSLGTLNLTYNHLPEFSLQEIKGLQNLRVVDLSHNSIKKLGGRKELQNHVELHTKVNELRLEYNQLEELGGALGGLSKLQRLNLSHNYLQKIEPDDLINLDDLRVLDISYNLLTTLEEFSKTHLNKLEELLASNNHLTVVGPDFHGLPVLCYADLRFNNITAIGSELASTTLCKKFDVQNILRIHFEGNPLICKEELIESLTVITKNYTEVYGIPDCSYSTTSSSGGE